MTLLFRLIAIAIIGFLCFSWWVSYQAQYYQTELGPQIRERYGFSTGTPMVVAGDQSVEVLTIYPEPVGFFEFAGVRDGDIVLSHSLTELYKALHHLQGDETLHVTDGGDGPPIEDRPVRTIVISSESN